MFKRLLSTNLNEFINIDLAVLFLRICGGLLIFTHGLPKLLKIINGDFSFADPLGLGSGLSLVLVAFAEGICSLFLIAGFATRYAATVLVLNMATIYFVVHASDPFGRKELPLLFLVVFVFLLFTGAGKYSVDAKVFDK